MRQKKMGLMAHFFCVKLRLRSPHQNTPWENDTKYESVAKRLNHYVVVDWAEQE